MKKIRSRTDKQKKIIGQSDNSNASNESKDKNLKLLSDDNNNANSSQEYGTPEVNKRYSSGIAIHERSNPDSSAPQKHDSAALAPRLQPQIIIEQPE